MFKKLLAICLITFSISTSFSVQEKKSENILVKAKNGILGTMFFVGRAIKKHPRVFLALGAAAAAVLHPKSREVLKVLISKLVANKQELVTKESITIQNSPISTPAIPAVDFSNSDSAFSIVLESMKHMDSSEIPGFSGFIKNNIEDEHKILIWITENHSLPEDYINRINSRLSFLQKKMDDMNIMLRMISVCC